jgi:hypothetical protein
MIKSRDKGILFMKSMRFEFKAIQQSSYRSFATLALVAGAVLASPSHAQDNRATEALQAFEDAVDRREASQRALLDFEESVAAKEKENILRKENLRREEMKRAEQALDEFEKAVVNQKSKDHESARARAQSIQEELEKLENAILKTEERRQLVALQKKFEELAAAYQAGDSDAMDELFRIMDEAHKVRGQMGEHEKTGPNETPRSAQDGYVLQLPRPAEQKVISLQPAQKKGLQLWIEP